MSPSTSSSGAVSASRPRRDQLVRGDAGLVLLRGLVDRGLREVGTPLQLEVAGAHAKAHLRAPPQVAGHVPHQIDLAGAVERDARADAHGVLEQRARLARAVDGDQLRRHAAGQRGVQLGRAEDVAAEPLLRQRGAHGERVVGLDRGQDARLALGPGGLQRAREAPGVAAQVILGDDRERRAEALRKRRDVAALDPQPPVETERHSSIGAFTATPRLYRVLSYGALALLLQAAGQMGTSVKHSDEGTQDERHQDTRRQAQAASGYWRRRARGARRRWCGGGCIAVRKLACRPEPGHRGGRGRPARREHHGAHRRDQEGDGRPDRGAGHRRHAHEGPGGSHRGTARHVRRTAVRTRRRPGRQAAAPAIARRPRRRPDLARRGRDVHRHLGQ